MTKHEKLLLKFILYPKNIQFHELETLLRQFGFHRIKTNAGSHMKWQNIQKDIRFSAPRKNPIKPAYIKKLIRMLNQYFTL